MGVHLSSNPSHKISLAYGISEASNPWIGGVNMRVIMSITYFINISPQYFHSIRFKSSKTPTTLLRHQLQLCTKHQLQQWSLMCVGRIVQDRSRQQHRNGPVDQFYLWKEWNTRTTVDGSSTQDLTIPFSFSHNVSSLPPLLEVRSFSFQDRNRSG